jgi:hypothetical protein
MEDVTIRVKASTGAAHHELATTRPSPDLIGDPVFRMTAKFVARPHTKLA